MDVTVGPLTKAEHQRIDAFELWCWRRLLWVSWTARRSKQSILKVINPEYALEGLMLKLKLQYFGHLMQRTDSLEKSLKLGKIEGERRSGWQRMIDWMASSIQWSKLQAIVKDWETRSTEIQGVSESSTTERLSNSDLRSSRACRQSCVCARVCMHMPAQLCPAPWDPMNCSPPCLSVH